jgi:hypothetical protein
MSLRRKHNLYTDRHRLSEEAGGGLATLKTHTFYTRWLGERSWIVDLGAKVAEFSTGIVQVIGGTCYAPEAFPSIFGQIPDCLAFTNTISQFPIKTDRCGFLVQLIESVIAITAP